MNPIDLTTVAAVREWIPGNPVANNAQDNAVIQSAITSISLDWLRRTGRGPRNFQVATQSPFNQPVQYTETYDGNGNSRMFLRNAPIVSVSSLTAFGKTVPQSTSPASAGWVIDDTAKSISLISPFAGRGYGGYGRWPAFQIGVLPQFPIGTQNIQITYTAGFNAQAITNELQVIPALPSAWVASKSYSAGAQIFDGVYVQTASIIGNALSSTSGTSDPAFSQTPGGYVTEGALVWTNSGLPYSVTANVLPWLGSTSVAYFSNGNPLTQVFTAPAQGQFFIQSPGSYLFNSADAGSQILLSYSASGTPPDVSLAVIRMVYLTYKRRGWEGLRSLAQKDVGQTTYAAWEVDPEVAEVIRNYTRTAITG
jgi:hypothetical protein